MSELDVLLHQPLRTQLVAFLAGADEVTFSDLKRQLDISDGNLDSHLKNSSPPITLPLARKRAVVAHSPNYALTPMRLDALRSYVKALQKLLQLDTLQSNSKRTALLRTT